MLTRPIPEFFRGPLGSHRNYITHIALENCDEDFRCKAGHEENGEVQNPGKYAELRLFLNAIESLNNIPITFFTSTPSALRGRRWESSDVR
jgi:hypothetical protein